MTAPIVYCLTRDHALAADLDARLPDGAIAFHYNDAARLHQAVTLRAPTIVLIDTGAIRSEYGDAGLGPVVAFVRDRAPGARTLVRPPVASSEHLVLAEAGQAVQLVPPDRGRCADAVAAACED